MAADHTDNRGAASDRRATVDRARSVLGGGGSVLLVGPAGIGKSTLAAGIVARRAVVVAQCLECFAALAQRPLSHALGTPLSGTPDDVATEVAGGLDGRLLMVEDLHWADPATIGTVATLAGRTPLLLTSRAPPPALDRAPIEQITVAPFTDRQAATLSRRVHPNLHPDDRAALVAAAAGNPLLITHLAHHDTVSPTFEAAIADRVHRLPANTLDALGRLALHGRPTLNLDMPDPAACDHIIICHPDDQVWFTHERFAAAIIDLLDNDVHDRDRLDRLRAELAATSESADAARHYLALDRRDDAARCAIAAAEVADASQAADLCAIAVDALGPRATNDLLLRAADAMISAHRPADARRLAARIKPGDDPVTAATAALHTARAAWLDGDQTTAATTIESALHLVAGTTTAIEAQLTVERAAIAARVRTGDPSIVELADAAVVAADRWGRHRARALSAAGLARARTGRPGWAECFTDAAAAARDDGDVEEECAAQYFLIGAYGRYGLLTKASELGREMLDRTHILGLRRWHHQLLAAHALHRAACDHLDDDLFEACRRLLVDEPLFRNRVQVELALAAGLADRGDVERATDLLDAGVESARNEEDLALLACGRCEVALATRNPARMERAVAGMARFADAYYWFNPIAESAAIHLAVATPGQTPVPRFPALAPMLETVRLEHEAYDLQLAGHPHDAIEEMGRAAESWERGGLGRFARRARCATVEIAHASGDPDLAAGLLDDLDADGWPESATTRRLDELRGLIDRARAARLLTKREIEILVLVAAGHTSARIADRLDIGVATVDTHIANARRRLGCKTRCQAAAMVVA